MDLSVFPRGKYYARQVNVKFKNSYSLKGEPFAITIEKLSKTHATVWDIDTFRPDLRDFPEFKQGVKALVLYERVNYSSKGCYKIPRYIVVGKKWFANVR